MDEGIEALIGIVGAYDDRLEHFEFAEGVFDQLTPFLHLVIEQKRLIRPGQQIADTDRLHE
jgi:hypothetical protein